MSSFWYIYVCVPLYKCKCVFLYTNSNANVHTHTHTCRHILHFYLHCMSEPSTVTYLSWVALHSMAHSFIELCKPVRHDKAVIHEGVLLHIHTKTRGTQRNFWRLLICLTLIVVMVSQLYAYVKPHQIVSIKCKFNV